MPALELPEIHATSPTLAETMRVCLLRAGLSRAGGSSNFVLGVPKAWLGTAYHEVLEKIVEVDLNQEALEDAVARLWNDAIAVQERRAAAHVLDRRFGAPVTWPGYHLARASVLLRAQELVGDTNLLNSSNGATRRGVDVSAVMREHEFSSPDGRLRGRPDVIRRDEVLDYKSGAILEHDATTQTDVLKAGYVRQLRIYGYLVKQKRASWPKRGILLPLGGVGVAVALDPVECEREAAEAIALLDSYTQRRLAAGSPADLASPSPTACRWCSFKLFCPAFWVASTAQWSGQLDGASVEGTVLGPPAIIHDGAARAVAIEIHAGSEPSRRAQIAPLSVATHSTANTLVSGEQIRLVGLRVRPDGVLAPTPRTVIARVGDLPTITI